jgi:tetratricopeptide (TPR) repeat protein
MPSLEQLKVFSESFRHIGGEVRRLLDAHTPYDALPLPSDDPPSPFPPKLDKPPDEFDWLADAVREETGGEVSDGEDGGIEPSGAAEENTASSGAAHGAEDSGETAFFGGGGDFDFSDLLGSGADLPGFGEEAAVPDTPGFGRTEEPEGAGADETGGTNDFSGAFQEPEPEESPESADGGEEAVDLSSIDLSPAIDMGSEENEEAFPDEEADGGISLPAEDFAPSGMDDDFSLDGLSGDDVSPEDPDGAVPDSASTEEAGDSAPLDDAGLSDFDLPDFSMDTSLDTADINAADTGTDAAVSGGDEETPPEEPAGFGDSEFDIPDIDSEGPFEDLGGESLENPVEDSGTENTEAGGEVFGEPPESGDSFDNFNFGEEDAAPDTGEAEESPEDFAADFSLEGFDEKLTGTTVPSGKATARRTGPSGAADTEVEELRLSDDEFQRLQETLSSYPLNLRIACEEIIAEQVIAPNLLSALVKLLTRGAPAKETAAMAGKILGRSIPVPKGFAKQTGAEFEEEQTSFGYIFVKKFLPILRIFIFAAMVLFVTGYLCWRFIINPFIANRIYQDGYERVFTGEYNRANDLFLQAFRRHPVKNWFYRYAEAFRDVRHYQFAERKYDELLRVYPRDKKGALDYAHLETAYLKNYEKADRILRDNILDYTVDDREGLFALAENNLAWGEERPERYEDARAAYARLIARYGRHDPFLEGMLKYFIRTDKLSETLPLSAYFMNKTKKRKIAVSTLSELGGYLLNKKFQDVQGVPDEYTDRIDGIRDILLRAIKEGPSLPEAYYHLARYYRRFGGENDERATLESAIRIFDASDEETPARAGYRVDTHRRYGEVLTLAGEFFPAAEQFSRGIRLYEDARTRGVLKSGSDFGMLYAGLGDLAFYAQAGDMEAALSYYRTAETNGYNPPEIQYRMGVAHYELGQWENALERFFELSAVIPNNRRLLYALGNTSYLRGNYFAAQSYYNRLLDLLDTERVRFPNIAPGSRAEAQDTAERMMVADNNLGVTLETLTRVSGDTSYRSRALGLFARSINAWDVLTRNPETMTRQRPLRDLYGPGVNLAYLNAQNILRPIPGYDQQIFMRIDRDIPEPSIWESLVPRNYRLTENLYREEARAAGF